MNDIKKTQHYSTDRQLVSNLIQYIPQNVKLIEPFVGTGSLVEIFPNAEWEKYDIEELCEGAIQRNTLLNPPAYDSKWVITNPPYLAKNKATDKTVFDRYPDYDDLYKVAIHTMLNCEGGILIVPVNFLSDDKSANIRNKFFERYDIVQLNIFTEQMFSSTTYNVCSFAFKKATESKTQIIVPLTVFPSEENRIITLCRDSNWRIGGEFLKDLFATPNVFSRLVAGKQAQNETHITINCIDKEDSPLHFYFIDEPYYGKESDRTIATLDCVEALTDQEQILIVQEANKLITNYRESCFNLCFTNYRDRNRKRIGFKEAYAFASLAYHNLKIEKNFKSMI